ncbi:MAG: hypothetical protein ACFE7E_00715 [Candidatus Hodarchaeota archaeon]
MKEKLNYRKIIIKTETKTHEKDVLVMILYGVSDTGDLNELKGDKPIKDYLVSDKVLILIDDDLKKIWIWKGKSAPVRQKFISARVANQIRQERGLTYKTLSIDEGDESQEFLDSSGAKPKKAPHPPLPAEPKPPAPVPAPESVPTPAASAPKPLAKQPEAPKTPMTSKATSPVPSPATAIVTPLEAEVISKLERVEIPRGYERELVIVGNEVYAITEYRTIFLGEKKVETKLEKAAKLPEGIFFAEGYTPRVIVDKGRVLAVEFLKTGKGVEVPTTDAAARSLRDEMKLHLSDLVDFFKIDIPKKEKKQKKEKKGKK